MAEIKLGYMYDQDRGVPQDYAKAVAWLQKASEKGERDAQSKLGFMYYGGKGVAKDFAMAAKWFRKAAEQGNPPSQIALGYMYKQVDGASIPENLQLFQVV